VEKENLNSPQLKICLRTIFLVVSVYLSYHIIVNWKYLKLFKIIFLNNFKYLLKWAEVYTKFITAFDQNWPVWSSININGQWYVAMSESGKSLGIDCWNINLYFKLFFRILASQKVRWPIYINRTSVVAHFK
jgi:hypothetical protein